jgi:hypothetical protein
MGGGGVSAGLSTGAGLLLQAAKMKMMRMLKSTPPFVLQEFVFLISVFSMISSLPGIPELVNSLLRTG